MKNTGQIFCSIPRCKNEAYGPCIFCHDDICTIHGYLNDIQLTYGLKVFLVCPHCRIRSINALAGLLDTLEDLWYKFRKRQYLKDGS